VPDPFSKQASPQSIRQAAQFKAQIRDAGESLEATELTAIMV
jgi:hypothetical protein